jgi:hypothetical protein
MMHLMNLVSLSERIRQSVFGNQLLSRNPLIKGLVEAYFFLLLYIDVKFSSTLRERTTDYMKMILEEII